MAVSGGPDSLALLLLAVAARPGQIEAATVDHRLRAESAAEAGDVATLCEDLGVPHATLAAQWDPAPESAVQERARAERYRLLAQWAEARGLSALATAHHADDQAETLLMRLNRGSGVRGLAAMRPRARVPSSELPLLRPLLEWRRERLVQVCADAAVSPAHDPSNADSHYERVRVRQALAAADWLDVPAIARSAANLADTDDALEWATGRVWDDLVKPGGGGLVFDPTGLPDEIQRRLAARAIAATGREGEPDNLRGREIDQLMVTLASGGVATLRGVRCSGGAAWQFSPAPPRRG
ncbi:tRNA lysidine(34) synthetase TilS [Sphingomonas sabuli]|uniref:tRNA lysidine(34) synthetase TilS n=1 Tax=Sphingomonas sabuli TaxID=2764186 RepID=UPI0024833B46|nr:tRNA lysidine(34) synthetase TilS [Sphingomonas sabuli]